MTSDSAARYLPRVDLPKAGAVAKLVRQRSAKPLCTGSTPVRASKPLILILQEMLYLVEEPSGLRKSTEFPVVWACVGLPNFVDSIHFVLLVVLRGMDVLLDLRADE